MSFARAVRAVAGLTMVSPVLGFIRDLLTADLLLFMPRGTYSSWSLRVSGKPRTARIVP